MMQGDSRDGAILRPMSLQVRVLGSIGVLLVLALLCGGAFLSLHARAVAEVEVRTAFQGAEQSVRDTLKSDVEHTVTLRQVVASFQGQRHVRAALVNEAGKVIVASQIAALSDPAPAWFARLMAPPAMSARIDINLRKYPCVVVLTSDPRSELAEVWDHVRDAFVTVLLFCAATMAVVSLAVAYALRFFRKFQTGLVAIANGSYDARLDTQGPPEFARLARGFNDMASRLAHYAASNRRLYQQLQNLQEEERAVIARDLHDEVGPYLFAIQVDAKAVAKLEPALGASVREAAIHIQRHVADILRQLRPVSGLDFGLEAAVADLVAFWSRRYPAVRFVRELDTVSELDRRRLETAWRIIQESVSNAVRHGEPEIIRIAVRDEDGRLLVMVEDNGGGLRRDPAATSLGHSGLAGMAERVRTLNGQLEIAELAHGVRISAVLPAARELEPA